MTAEVVNTFQTKLDALGVEWTHTTVDESEQTLAEIIDGPTVGVPIAIDGVRLPDSVTVDPTPNELREATTGITAASLAIADYGTLVLESTPSGAEQASLFPDLHVAVLGIDDIVPTMLAAFEWLGPRLRNAREGGTAQADGGSAVLATGPSATADMGALVRGAHGPKAVHVVIVDDAARTADGPADERSETVDE